jgi:hypothetical protein
VHDKVYSGEYFAKNPPLWFWICSKCLEQGTDELINKPTVALFSYIMLLEKVDSKSASSLKKIQELRSERASSREPAHSL